VPPEFGFKTFCRCSPAAGAIVADWFVGASPRSDPQRVGKVSCAKALV
jgi:hypothetical protein